MILTQKQEQGLKLCIEKYLSNERFCVISGYAGAGKSSKKRAFFLRTTQ